jgi:hypothetical protein
MAYTSKRSRSLPCNKQKTLASAILPTHALRGSYCAVTGNQIATEYLALIFEVPLTFV